MRVRQFLDTFTSGTYRFSSVKGEFVEMMQELGEAEVIGPILLGIRKPVQVLQMESSVREIVNMTAITVIDAQTSTDEIIQL